MSSPSRGNSQRGAAALAVVMVLFFIMAMVAAYTNRNLVFEQRTSANSYRTARSLAAADAAVDWTISMLNGGIIGTTCTSTGATDDFRTRYLSVQPDGRFQPKTWPTIFSGTPVAAGDIQAQPSCSGTDGGGWVCSCPILTPPAQLDVANSEEPTFAVKFADSSPGAIALKIRACNSMRSGTVTASNVNSFGSCHVNEIDPQGPGQIHKSYVQVDSMTTLRLSLGLISALPVAPSAALTAAGSINQTAGTLTVINPDSLTGLALHAGGTISAPVTVRVAGPAGSTASATSESDADLSGIPPSDFFRKSLGMPADKYKRQPAAVRIDCGGGCNSTANVIPELAKGPTRVIYVDGDLDLNTASAIAAIGSDATPTMLVVSGNVTVSAPIAFKGVLYVEGNLNWTATGGTVNGAVIVGGGYTGTGAATVAYNRNIVQKIHKGYGSFVRIPGSWTLES
jgi:hypothetical protein